MDLLIYSYFLSIFSLINSLISIKYKDVFYNLYLIFFNISFFLLIYKFIISDYSYSLILYNTHELDFLLYKVLALWSNNEGAIFLLCFLLSNLSFWFLNNRYLNILPITLYNRILQLLLYFLLVFNFVNFFIFNPFQKIYWFLLEGFEFNILLQDPLFVIHPPILFIGYISFIILYTFLINIKNLNNIFLEKYKKELTTELYYLSLFCWIFITLGILLGSWWAYYELGWEGWWSWDPVENLSLMPWLLMTVFLHSYNLEKDINLKGTLYLYIGFLLSISSLMSLFFVRSGFLNSVHAFVNDYTSGVWLLFFLSIFLLIFFYLYLQIKNNKDNLKFYYSVFSTKGYLFLFININIFFFFIVIFGTFFPVIYNIIWNNDLSLNNSFYNNSLKLLLIPLLYVLLLHNLNYKNIIVLNSKIFYIIVGFLLFSNIILYYYYDLPFLLINLLISLVLLNILACFWKLIYFRLKLTNSFFSHLGFLLATFGVLIFSSFKKELHINLEPLSKIKLDNIDLIFRGYDLVKKQIYTSSYGNFIFKWNNYDWFVFPEQTFSFFSGVMMTKSIVLSNFLMDCYITILEDGYSSLIHITYNFLTSFIWLGGFLIVLSSIIYLKKINYKEINNIWF